MKVFISWSGERSKAVAEFLGEWLQCVIQNCRPWISSHGIDAGSIWFQEINDALQHSQLGIVCLTQENKDNPWILFEAGALARGITTQRVCTFLSDLKPSDIRDPLAQFNHTSPDKESVKNLVRTINTLMGEQRMKESVLLKVFDQYWMSFTKDFQAILESLPENPKAKPRKEPEIMEEILGAVRRLDHRLQHLESQSSHRQEGGKVWISSDPTPPPTTTRRPINLSRIRALLSAGAPDEFIVDAFEKEGHSADSVLHNIQRVRRRHNL